MKHLDQLIEELQTFFPELSPSEQEQFSLLMTKLQHQIPDVPLDPVYKAQLLHTLQTQLRQSQSLQQASISGRIHRYRAALTVVPLIAVVAVLGWRGGFFTTDQEIGKRELTLPINIPQDTAPAGKTLEQESIPTPTEARLNADDLVHVLNEIDETTLPQAPQKTTPTYEQPKQVSPAPSAKPTEDTTTPGGGTPSIDHKDTDQSAYIQQEGEKAPKKQINNTTVGLDKSSTIPSSEDEVLLSAKLALPTQGEEEKNTYEEVAPADSDMLMDEAPKEDTAYSNNYDRLDDDAYHAEDSYDGGDSNLPTATTTLSYYLNALQAGDASIAITYSDGNPAIRKNIETYITSLSTGATISTQIVSSTETTTNMQKISTIQVNIVIHHEDTQIQATKQTLTYMLHLDLTHDTPTRYITDVL